MNPSRPPSGSKRVASIGLAGAAALFAASCASLGNGAAARFATEYTCPPDRVTVAAVPQPPMLVLAPPSAPLPGPPLDVAADPERAAYFREQAVKKQEAETAAYEHLYNGRSFYEVSGCGHLAIYGCGHPARPADEGSAAPEWNHVDCIKAAGPDAPSR